MACAVHKHCTLNWFLTLCYTPILALLFRSAKAQKCEITACLPVRKQVRTLVQMKPMPLATMLGCLPCSAHRPRPRPATSPLLPSWSLPYICPSWGYTGAWGNSSQGTEAAEQPRPRGTACPLGGWGAAGQVPYSCLVLQASAARRWGGQALGVGQPGSDLSCETSGK